ncbi:hypothetical protein Gotri_025427 [Gossypium trilobum]|uniref:40S ribosomal protein S6 n=1 Tax=Gossypium trilobum TaxID=34281 RepID=A0A7J9FJ46_9ROSI|nr:hypothetical protein [Gossypium trilobum]
MGGCDKQGFPMKQGVLTPGCVRTPCFRGYGRRNGEHRTKSVRGCIVSQDLSVLNLVIVKKGENDVPGLTDTEKPRMRGSKRASKIRKLFNLSKEDDDAVDNRNVVVNSRKPEVKNDVEEEMSVKHLTRKKRVICELQNQQAFSGALISAATDAAKDSAATFSDVFRKRRR